MSKIVQISEETIKTNELIEQMKDNLAGALSIFIGTTKEIFNGKRVLKLFYEAHPTMALKKLNEIADYCVKAFDLIGICIVHRTGFVNVKEESVLIISVSVSRKQAIESTGFCIDEIKKIVPIWKLEEFEEEDGKINSVWKEDQSSIHFFK